MDDRGVSDVVIADAARRRQTRALTGSSSWVVLRAVPVRASDRARDGETVTAIMLVDDHAVVRAGLRLLLESQPDISVVGEASSADEALRLPLEQDPELIVTDLSMQGLRGAAVVEALAQRFPNALILVLSMVDNPADVRRAMDAGARGYMLKDAAAAELPEAIARILKGELYVQPAVGALLAARAATPRIHGDPIAALSEREREMLDLLVLGHTNVEIAALIFLSPRTVETHRANIQRKLGVKSRADLVRFASRHSAGTDGSSTELRVSGIDAADI